MAGSQCSGLCSPLHPVGHPTMPPPPPAFGPTLGYLSACSSSPNGTTRQNHGASPLSHSRHSVRFFPSHSASSPSCVPPLPSSTCSRFVPAFTAAAVASAVASKSMLRGAWRGEFGRRGHQTCLYPRRSITTDPHHGRCIRAPEHKSKRPRTSRRARAPVVDLAPETSVRTHRRGSLGERPEHRRCRCEPLSRYPARTFMSPSLFHHCTLPSPPIAFEVAVRLLSRSGPERSCESFACSPFAASILCLFRHLVSHL